MFFIHEFSVKGVTSGVHVRCLGAHGCLDLGLRALGVYTFLGTYALLLFDTKLEIQYLPAVLFRGLSANLLRVPT